MGLRLGRVAEDHAVALQTVDRGQRQPAAREHRPRAHGDDHRVARDLLPVHHGTAHGAFVAEHESGDGAQQQARARSNRRAHHGLGEVGRVDLGRGFAGAELAVDGRILGQPAGPVELPEGAHVAARAGDHAERVEPAVAPLVVDRPGKLSVQGEAAPRQRLGRRAVAPVERQEPARLGPRPRWRYRCARSPRPRCRAGRGSRRWTCRSRHRRRSTPAFRHLDG